MATQSTQVLQPHPLVSRAEIDTSAPFESVKDAANLFGGMGFCRKPISHHNFYSSQNADQKQDGDGEILGIVEVEEQAVQLERDLIMKEKETHEVLKELETTKNVVEELKLKVQGTLKENPFDNKENLVAQVPEEGKLGSDKGVHTNGASAPGYILQELKQAKLNLTRTVNDLADIRATVDLYNKKIEKQRMSLEKTRQRLFSNASKIPCPEEELNQAKQKQEGDLTDTDDQGSGQDPMNISRELQKLSSETEQFKQVGEAAKSQVSRAISKIEQTKTRIKNAEMRLFAAKRMKEAAKASEAVALAEIKALSKSGNKVTESQKNLEDVTLSFEEYSSLVSKAEKAGKAACPGRGVDTIPSQVDEVNVSKTEILNRVAEATEEVKTSKRALEEALSRVEAATRGKLEVEDALRMWRSNHGHKRRGSLHNCTRSKKGQPLAGRKESRLVEASGLDLGNDELKPVLKTSLSIGQILSRKLWLTEEYGNGIRTENNIMGTHKVSLGQMLRRRRSADLRSAKVAGKENYEIPAKGTKFGLGRIPLLVAHRSKKNRNKTKSPVCGMAAHKLEFL